MTVPVEFLQVALALAMTVSPVIVMIRLLAGYGDFGFDAIFRFDATLPWPRGMQEEEPQPWRHKSAVA